MIDRRTRLALASVGRLGWLLVFAAVLATVFGFREPWGDYVLYGALLLVLIGAASAYRVMRAVRNIVGAVAQLAVLFWLLLVVFNVSLLPLTGSQLFWVVVLAVAVRIFLGLEIS